MTGALPHATMRLATRPSAAESAADVLNGAQLAADRLALQRLWVCLPKWQAALFVPGDDRSSQQHSPGMARSLLFLLLLAGCAGPTVERPCFALQNTWNMDDANPIIRIQMVNVGRYCGSGVRADRRASEATGRIIIPPEHGRARIRVVDQSARAEYLPERGFVGQDTFRASLGPTSGAITFVMTVQAPP